MDDDLDGVGLQGGLVSGQLVWRRCRLVADQGAIICLCARDIVSQPCKKPVRRGGRSWPITRSRHLSAIYHSRNQLHPTADRDAVDGEDPGPTVGWLELITYWEFTWNWWLFSTSSIDRGISTVEITERRIEPSESASDPRRSARSAHCRRHRFYRAPLYAGCGDHSAVPLTVKVSRASMVKPSFR